MQTFEITALLMVLTAPFNFINFPVSRLANRWNPERNERSLLMNYSDMMNQTSGWMGGGMVIWTVVGIFVGVIVIVLISKLTKK